jgi:hypothetical protein
MRESDSLYQDANRKSRIRSDLLFDVRGGGLALALAEEQAPKAVIGFDPIFPTCILINAFIALDPPMIGIDSPVRVDASVI